MSWLVVACLGLGATIAGSVAVLLAPAPRPERAPRPLARALCPPLGFELSDGRVVVALSDFEGVAAIPLGRSFVVVDCVR